MDEKKKFLNSLARLLLTNEDVQKCILENIDQTSPSAIPATAAAPPPPVPPSVTTANSDVPAVNPVPPSTGKKASTAPAPAPNQSEDHSNNSNSSPFDDQELFLSVADFDAKDLEPSSSNEFQEPSNTSAFAEGTKTSKFSSSSKEQALFAVPEASQSRLARCNKDKKWKLLKVPHSQKAKPSEEVITIESDTDDLPNPSNNLCLRNDFESLPNPSDAMTNVISEVLSGTKVLNSPTQLLELFNSATNVQFPDVESKREAQSAAYRKGKFYPSNMISILIRNIFSN